MNQLGSKPTNVFLLIRFFVVTYVISWSIWIPMALSSQGIITIQTPVLLGIMIGGISPSLSAIALTMIEEGKEGIQNLLARLLRWRVKIQWYLFTLFAPVVILICAVALNALLENSRHLFPVIGNGAMLVTLFLVTLVLGGPLGEEIGWRGYSLPRLLSNWTALSASLVLGALWGLWHLPLFWIQGSAQAGIPIAGFMLSILAESILYTWIHIYTSGSLLLVIIFHAAVNTWARLILLPLLNGSIGPLWIAFVLEIVLAFIVVVSSRGKFLQKPGVQTSV